MRLIKTEEGDSTPQKVPTAGEIQKGFANAQQCLVMLQECPQGLLDTVTFGYLDGDTRSSFGIDEAIGLLDYEVQRLKAARQNFRAASVGRYETIEMI